MISVIILTKNEEKDLPICLSSLRWTDDVIVLDSGSTDNTISIARAFGASVYEHEFISFGDQRNYAIDYIETRYNWILFLDADEVVTDAFKNSIIEAISQSEDKYAGFYCCWKMMLEDTWLKRCDNYPKWQFRLMRKGKARFKDFGHGQKEDKLVGEAGYIREPYLHYGFSKGWSSWIERHNKYSNQEAVARMKNKQPFSQIFTKHSSQRNPALKYWLTKLPGWPLIRFMQAYFFNLGFTEGMPGFIYCVNMAYYEFLIQIKIREITKRKVVQDSIEVCVS